MKHIGLLAHSSEGSALCYLETCHEGMRRLGPHMHPEITMNFAAMGHSMAAWEAMNLPRIRATLARGIERLAAAGADFFACPDNTAHLALDVAGEPFALPGLHIADTVCATAAARGHHRIALTGTKWTMEGDSYRTAAARHGVEVMMPDDAARAFIQAAIFDELCQGIFRDETRDGFLRIIAEMKDEGCDSVALSCTEIPLIVTPENSPLPTLDSTRLLAQAAVDVALGARALPEWRGGPIA